MEEFNNPKGTLPDARSQNSGLRRHRKFLAQISRLLGTAPSATKLLDVGCSSGAFLGSALQLGYVAEGVEPAPRAAATAQSRGLKVFNGLLHEARFDTASFDAVSLLEVIEHLKEPLPVLQECARLLRPGGVLLIGTGNTDSWQASAFGPKWDYLQIDRHGGHVSFFNQTSLEMLSKQAGLSVAAIKTRGLRFSDRSTRRDPVYTLQKIAAELLTPLAQALDKGCDMAMYLRKAD
jgi:SAM-dependent methyltransferase